MKISPIRHLFLAMGLILSSSCFSQDDLQKISDKLQYLGGKSLSELSPANDSLKRLILHTNFLRDAQLAEDKLSTKVSFGANANSNATQQLYSINGGISLSSGVYPGEFRMASNFGITLSNGSFKENISNLSISYDWHAPNQDLKSEWFSFLDRFSNSYMGIDQRYLVGIGHVWNAYAKQMNKGGQSFNDKLMRFNYIDDEASGDADFTHCSDQICSKVDAVEMTEGDKEKIKNAQRNLSFANLKKNTKLRASILAGVLFEVEKGTASDSIQLADNNFESFNENFDGTFKIRAEIRPAITLRSDETVEFSIKPYFILPMPWERDYILQEGEGDSFQEFRRFDYRIDAKAALTINPDKAVGIELSYRYLYDNSPNSKFVQASDNQFYLLSAQEFHHIFRMSVNFKI